MATSSPRRAGARLVTGRSGAPLAENSTISSDANNSSGDLHSRRRFEIYGLSGTSAGALNAFMVWYGMMLKDGQKGVFAETRKAVNNLWDTFQMRKSGEWGINLLGQQAYKLQDFGIDIRPQYPPYFSDWLTWALHQWSAAENLIAPKLDFGEVRPEFYDFASLLRRCAPGAMDCAFGAGYDGAFLEGIGEYGIREASGTRQFHEDRSMPEESNFHGNHPRPFGPAKKASQLRSRGNNADLAASGSIGPPVCRWANPLPRP
jgi:hypothetical protein